MKTVKRSDKLAFSSSGSMRDVVGGGAHFGERGDREG